METEPTPMTPGVGITVIGVGYVGLVTGTCLSETGNKVICVDIDAKRIENLREGILPIYEPGLEELVLRNYRAGRLEFSTELESALATTSVVIVAVGTPQDPITGAADLGALWAVAREIRAKATESKIVVVKSTVPVGTNRQITALLNQNNPIVHHTASNPEFLKEGHAIEDFMKPNRVVVGVRDSKTEEVLRTIHSPFLRSDRPFLVMSPESSEMTKYVTNCMLATKISFINEMANLCESFGADINEVRRGIGHDERIGFHFLYPGPGYGGSCFPKDVRALMAMSEAAGKPSRVLPAVDQANEHQKTMLFRKIVEVMGTDLSGKTVGIWGLAFKPGTDDVREAPALVLIRRLLIAGAAVRVFDPEAMSNVREIFGDRITYCKNAYATLQGCDALAIVTEWKEFHVPDFTLMRSLMNQPLIIDGRNIYDVTHMENLGFNYVSLGRRTVWAGEQQTEMRRVA